MNPVKIGIYILFIGTLIHQVRRLRNLLIPAKRRMGEIIATVLSVIVIFGLTYFYGNGPVHYLVGLLAMMIIAFYPFTFGITPKGFSYNRGAVMGFLAPWRRIKNVRMVIKRDKIIVSFSGHGHFDLHFAKDRYEELVNVLEKNLSPGVLKQHTNVQ